MTVTTSKVTFPIAHAKRMPGRRRAARRCAPGPPAARRRCTHAGEAGHVITGTPGREHVSWQEPHRLAWPPLEGGRRHRCQPAPDAERPAASGWKTQCIRHARKLRPGPRPGGSVSRVGEHDERRAISASGRHAGRQAGRKQAAGLPHLRDLSAAPATCAAASWPSHRLPTCWSTPRS